MNIATNNNNDNNNTMTTSQTTENNDNANETRLTLSAAVKIVIKENRQKIIILWVFVCVFYFVSTILVEYAQLENNTKLPKTIYATKTTTTTTTTISYNDALNNKYNNKQDENITSLYNNNYNQASNNTTNHNDPSSSFKNNVNQSYHNDNNNNNDKFHSNNTAEVSLQNQQQQPPTPTPPPSAPLSVSSWQQDPYNKTITNSSTMLTKQVKNNESTHNDDDTTMTTQNNAGIKQQQPQPQQQINKFRLKTNKLEFLSNASITKAAAVGLPIISDLYLKKIRASQRVEKDPSQCVGINIEKSNSTYYDQYYYLHIPKVGGSTMHNWLSSNGAWVHNNGQGAPLDGKYGKPSLNEICQKNPKRRVFMTEGVGFNVYRPQHSVVVFRNPYTHVLSQYFHCAESKDHKEYATLMPRDITIWLKYWNNQLYINSNDIFHVQSNTGRWKDSRYACYNPVNLQSWLVGFPSTKQELATWFDAVGVQSHFKQSFCVIYITIMGFVPKVCNCTNGIPPPTKNENNKKNQRKKNNYNRENHYGHGVKHHGDSFNSTSYQQELISNITTLDQQLYKWAEELFQEKLESIEKEFNVTLCDE